jgi:SAM-dependent methyltransferase
VAGSQTTGGTGLRRSLRLLRGFRVEQSDPARFYSLMAADSVAIIEAYAGLDGSTVLDVGAGRPEFASAFTARGARYVWVDQDLAAPILGTPGRAWTVIGRGQELALRDASVDVAFCSNVFEHVPDPRRLGAELVRVTRPGGLVVVAYTNWLSPWGGHETSPFHYLGGRRAIALYTRRYGHAPKNVVGENLFRVSVADGLRWAQTQAGTQLLSARPRYYPDGWAWLTRIPGLRELATWNLLLVLRRV